MSISDFFMSLFRRVKPSRPVAPPVSPTPSKPVVPVPPVEPPVPVTPPTPPAPPVVPPTPPAPPVQPTPPVTPPVTPPPTNPGTPGTPVTPVPPTLAYQYTIPTGGAITSAGVYNGAIKIRNLWTTLKQSAGTYNITWDGTNDSGTAVTPGTYTVKITGGSVNYAWVGVFGNTSSSNVGSGVHRGYYRCMNGMCFTPSSAYFTKGYSERSPSLSKFTTGKPQVKVNIYPFTDTTADNDFIATDGAKVYVGAYDPGNANTTFVYAINASDDSPVIFASGKNYNISLGGKAYSGIGFLSQSSSLISGLAVQKTGSLLFVSRDGLNQIQVLNKTTGALVNTLTVANAKSVAVDQSDNLWVVSGANGSANITKYSVSTSGVLSAALLTITSIGLPVALAVSPDNSTLAVADGTISSQQVKAFNNTTGAATWTLGSAGGYMSDASVGNNKFYFNDVRGILYQGSASPGFGVFIAYQPDGTFWVNDPGNYRVQHYSAAQAYIETIMSLPASYSTWADKNNNTRVGAEYLEFALDHSQPLTGSTGWSLVKNWGANISTSYDPTTKITNFITLTASSVSHTYGFLRIGNNYTLVEFMANNTLRISSVVIPHANIDANGDLLTDDFKRRVFSGFDGSNNPIWGSPVTLSSIALDTAPYIGQWVNAPYVTSTGKIMVYNPQIHLADGVTLDHGQHLAAIQSGQSTFLWKAGQATHTDYIGQFPNDDGFDIGNKVNDNAGSSVVVLGQNVITGYHGEFWRDSQTNMYNHYWDNGLALGQFGTVGPQNSESPAMMAGNALSPQLVKGATSDDAYVVHGDESYHGAAHLWHITGLNSVFEQDVPITLPSSLLTPPATIGINLMKGLAYDTSFTTSSSGWSVSPAVGSGWSVRTNAFVDGQLNNPDLYLSCSSTSGNYSLNRDLGSNTGLTTWSITGQINYYGSDQQGGMKQYVDVLDVNGKIIARISNTWTFVNNTGGNTNTIFGNGKQIVTGLNDSFIQPIMFNLQNLSISVSGSNVTINYGGYSVTAPVFDATALIGSPKTLRHLVTGGANATGRNFDFKDMVFVP